jgi:hypothetical protein
MAAQGDLALGAGKHGAHRAHGLHERRAIRRRKPGQALADFLARARVERVERALPLRGQREPPAPRILRRGLRLQPVRVLAAPVRLLRMPIC